MYGHFVERSPDSHNRYSYLRFILMHRFVRAVSYEWKMHVLAQRTVIAQDKLWIHI